MNKLKATAGVREQFQMLKYRLLSMLNGKGGGPVVLAFTSYRRKEGVSTTVVNLARLMSEEHFKVLLVDANLEHPSMHAHFKDKANGNGNGNGNGQSNGNGNGNGHEGNELLDMRQRRMVHAGANLDVITTADPKTGLPRMMNINKLSMFLKKAREHYDFVFIDCPPLSTGSAASLVSARADGVILVVESGRSRRQAMKRALMELNSLQANILGVVLNKRRYPIPGFIYRRL